MHRVRVGLTGLACVFLLVMLATAFLGTRRDTRPAPSAAANMIEPNEPLAQLGVAPGNPSPPDAPVAKRAPTRH